MVEYAYAISSGVTPSLRPPSVIAGFVDTRVFRPIFWAIFATRRVPSFKPSSANTELSEWAVAFARVVTPEYSLSKLFTTNFSFPRVPGTGKIFLRELHSEYGLTPWVSAVARANGLNDEPGCRWPLVARLNGLRSKLVPPTIALTSPVLLSITTIDAPGP